MTGRREFIQTASTLAAAAVFERAAGAQEIPNSIGSEPPKLKAPAGACDCHHHIYDRARFPPATPNGVIIPNARVEEYQMYKRRIGTSRDIIVTPLAYRFDNRVTLDAIKRLGPGALGVAVVNPSITDAELKALNDGGIRGIRFSLSDPKLAPTTVEMIEPLSKRINALGWHVQLNMTAEQILAVKDMWDRLPSKMVFDHMAHVRLPQGVKDPVFDLVRRLVDKGRTWVKLSVTYDDTKEAQPSYEGLTKIAQAYVKAAPERMLWGSNWPHPNETKKPDDAKLFDLMSDWAPNETTRNKVLIHNPAALYGFPKAV